MATFTLEMSKEFHEAQKLLDAYPEKAQRALASVLNRVIDGVQTDLARETKERYYTKSAEVRKTFSIHHASAGHLEAKVISRGPRKNIMDYKLNHAGKRKSGFLGAVKKDGGLKPLGRAFFLKLGKGYKPFIRTGRGRGEIEPIVSPAIPQIVKNEDTVETMQKLATERFQKRLTHELGRLQS